MPLELCLLELSRFYQPRRDESGASRRDWDRAEKPAHRPFISDGFILLDWRFFLDR